MSYKGIDVSDNQGVISWPKVAEAGVDFAVLRSVRGSGKVDHQFYNNINGCRVNGIPFDVYKYSYADTIAKAIAEAEAVVKLLKENDIHCTVWWDMEDKSLRGLGKSMLTKLINAAKDVIESAGYQFGIYCNADWYKNVLDAKAFDCPFWVARYVPSDRMELTDKPIESYKPVVTHKLFGWQYSSKGHVPGIEGNVDLDMIYADINGDAGTDQEKPVRTAQKFLDVLRCWIGYSEDNRRFKQIIDTYNSHKPLARGYAVKYTDEWCDTTISAAAIVAGMVDLLGTECSCEEHIKIFKKLGIWIEDGTITPKPGDIILYNWGDSTQPNDGRADHIGAVESVSNGQITVIEGNKGEAVAKRVISVGNGYIRGYAAPRYDKASEFPQPPKEDELNRSVAWYGTVNTAALNVRTWPGTENPKLKSYPTIMQSTVVGVCDVAKDKDGDPWYYVKLNGNQGEKYGFVSAAYITKQDGSNPDTPSNGGMLSKAPKWTGKVTASALNVRTWAGTNNSTIKSHPKLTKGEQVDVCDTVNAADGSKWYYVRIDGKVYGFVHSAYIVA